MYLAIWVAVGAVALAALGWWMPLRSDATLGLALAVAAAWQLTRAKRAAVIRCHWTTPLPPHGWRATAGTARFAVRNGSACVTSCWAMMLVMVVAVSGQLVWMVVVTAIVSAEKLTRKPRRATRYSAAVLAAAAAGATALAVA